MKWSIIKKDDLETLVLVLNGEVYHAEMDHPAFAEIKETLLDYEEGDEWDDGDVQYLLRLLDMSKPVEELFEKVSTKVRLKGSTLYFNDKPLDGVLAEHVIRSIREGGNDHLPFIAFWEKVEENPNEHSRKQLLKWLMAEDFAITSDGLIVGYKGVREDFKSSTAGPGIVNGKPVEGNLDNSIGNVVEMSRFSVTHDPNQHCAKGLHVGTWRYASNFSQKTVEVHVHPKDVVSVPNDSNGEKMRVCKYKVIRELQQNYTMSVLKEKQPA